MFIPFTLNIPSSTYQGAVSGTVFKPGNAMYSFYLEDIVLFLWPPEGYLEDMEQILKLQFASFVAVMVQN